MQTIIVHNVEGDIEENARILWECAKVNAYNANRLRNRNGKATGNPPETYWRKHYDLALSQFAQANALTWVLLRLKPGWKIKWDGRR